MTNHEDSVKLSLSILLEEYKALRAELLQTMAHTRQVVQFALVIVAALIAGTPTIIKDSQLAFLFLLAPLIFLTLNLTFLRYMYLHTEIIDHLRTHVNPLIRARLLTLDGQEEIFCKQKEALSQIMTWEDRAGGSGPFRRYKVWYWPIFIASAGSIMLSGVFSLVGYFVVVFQRCLSISGLEKLLIAVNVIGLIYTMVFGFRVGRRK